MKNKIKNLNDDQLALLISLGVTAVIGIIDYAGYKKAVQCVKDGYAVYLNGCEIDGKKVRLYHYKYSLNHKRKEIYLATCK